MNAARWTWLALLLAYGLFFSWYTSFGGPLTQDEIDSYLALLELQNPDPDPADVARVRQFMETDTGDDFVMVNVIDMYDTPLQIEGVEPGDTSDDVLAKYMEYMTPALFGRACHPVIVGRAASPALDLMNAPGMERWTRGAGMRYRSRRDLFEISTNPEFAGRHEFKVAAMAKTIAFPIDPWFQLGDPRLLLALLFGWVGSAVGWLTARRA